MTSKFAPQKHHRRSIRFKGFDYASPGGYFVTIVTYQRECLFGEIVNQKMKLSNYGSIADECWRAIPEHFPNIEIGAHIVMPNHVHGIIVIRDAADANASARRGTIYRAPTEQYGRPVIGSVPTIVRTFKAAVTRRIGRELQAVSVWQRNYYEHIIRDENEWNRTHVYIEFNPFMWESDEENPFMSTSKTT